MKKNKLAIKKYWINTPQLFSEQYKTNICTIVSPTKMFLYERRKKVLSIIGNIKGKKILDIGCGSGIFIAEFVKKGAFVTGVDYSTKMLSSAKSELDKYKINKSKYKLIKANATKLPFKKRYFDIILATGLTDYLSDKQNEKFIEEASRVLKKNGKLIISFPSKTSPVSFLRQGIGLWIRQKLMKLPPIANSFSERDIQILLDKANLKSINKLKVFFTMWIIIANHKD